MLTYKKEGSYACFKQDINDVCHSCPCLSTWSMICFQQFGTTVLPLPSTIQQVTYRAVVPNTLVGQAFKDPRLYQKKLKKHVDTLVSTRVSVDSLYSCQAKGSRSSILDL